MIPTDDLISALTANLRPVRRLRPPLLRATGFLLLAALILAMIAAAHGWRPGLLVRLAEIRFALSLAGALFTGALAAVAAFLVSLPGRSRHWLWLPFPALALWLFSIGYQCLSFWTPMVPGDASPGETASCVATLVLTSLPLSLALGLMLRHAANFNPAPVIFAASLSVAGITATALTLFHPIDASVEILMFNLGTGLLIMLSGAAINLFLSKRKETPE
ncbi:NrsF family protein [Mesorhizobium sp. WSM4884]|uniref:NrsF family protein n=1 Tax=Mesorhizobium sp. WSM4884 TaxID=3038542 RepID=UPI002417477E|nr:NrsF family protein [Mesorhizobium sp. WSM4884]MDG4885423.1 NrsF family protein [Mesorhizobium sp. WSM4884]